MTKKLLTLIGIFILGIGLGVVLFGNNPSNKNQTPTSSTRQQGTSLDYSNQQLIHFPKEALSKTDSTSLNLSHNQLTGALPAEIKKLSKLQQLDVSYNQMTGIPAEIGQMKSLRVLDYSNNQITGLPMELGNLTDLQVLDLTGNPKISQHDLGIIRAKLTHTQIRT